MSLLSENCDYDLNQRYNSRNRIGGEGDGHGNGYSDGNGDSTFQIGCENFSMLGDCANSGYPELTDYKLVKP